MTEQQALAPIAADVLASVTGGYHDPSPSNSDTGTAGLGTAPCTPPANPQPSSSPVWILI
jgi:hypothetical protein